LLTIARAVNNLCRRLLPNEWLCPYAASQPRSRGVQMAVNCAIRGKCIRTRLPRAASHEVILIATFGDRFGLARPDGLEGARKCLEKTVAGSTQLGISVRDDIIIGKNGPASMVSNRQISMRSTPLIAIAVSLIIAAVAFAIPFTAPMVWSYWASSIWCAVVIGAIAVHGKPALWALLGAPPALWHIGFAALIYIAWR
jgi:hypothetical protein